MNQAKNIPDWLVVGMNMAMLGMIHENIRLIRVDFDEKNNHVSIFNYLSREVLDDDYEDMEEIATELDAMMGNHFNKLDILCIYSNHTARELNLLPGAVFRRRE